jgi:tetratricopeptide (TPR) repeat protein
MMSAGLESTDEVCASCGQAAVDDVKLKKCGCKLVKYCSVDCQKNHRPQHKKACKKRLAEIRDDRLFKQPDESHRGECPICCLPLPLDNSKTTISSCCSKLICDGCNFANRVREMRESLEARCAFCREPIPDTKDESVKNLMERIKVNDPVALYQVGSLCHKEGDYEQAFKYYTKAAALGDIQSHYCLSLSYDKGQGVESDLKKKMHHLEEAAIGGHHSARFNLGVYERDNGRFDRMVKHFIIAAKLGDGEALEGVKMSFQMGLVSKDDYEAALRGHQAAVDAMKSQQRDAVAVAKDKELKNRG